jgi:hypothetical protein
MLEPQQLPTDSVYKFASIAGLICVVASLYGYLKFYADYSENIREIILKMEEYGGRKDGLEELRKNLKYNFDSYSKVLSDYNRQAGESGKGDSTFDEAHFWATDGGWPLREYLTKNLDRRSAFFINDLRVIALIDAKFEYESARREIDSLGLAVQLLEREQKIIWDSFERPQWILLVLFLVGIVIFSWGIFQWYWKKQVFDDMIARGMAK